MTKVDQLVERTAEAIIGGLLGLRGLSAQRMPGLKIVLRLFADEIASERGLTRRKPFGGHRKDAAK